MHKHFLALILTFALFATIAMPSKAITDELNAVSEPIENVRTGDVSFHLQENSVENIPAPEVPAEPNIE